VVKPTPKKRKLLIEDRKKELRIAGKKADPFHWYETAISQYVITVLFSKELVFGNFMTQRADYQK
jgi:hypothetical protein